ncbi:MAG: response regulator transcription factor [Chloroflexi bacterium]|nr:response regulator transcription factor [Chloroflexota bacterium]
MATGTGVETTKVVLVDDHELARQGVRMLLSEDRGIEVVGEADSSWEAISLIEQLRPNVAILDIRLRNSTGFEVVSACRSTSPHTRFILLSAFCDERYVHRSLGLGIHAFLLKSASRDELIGAIHHVARGGLMFQADVADTVLATIARSNIPPCPKNWNGNLSRREKEVFRQMSLGLRNQEIAEALGISLRTAEAHVGHILLKFGAKSRTQAVLLSQAEGSCLENSSHWTG